MMHVNNTSNDDIPAGRKDIQYSASTKPNTNADLVIDTDLMTRHITLPPIYRNMFIIAVSNLCRWFAGEYSFDELMDKLGEINDYMTSPDHTVDLNQCTMSRN